MLNHPGIAAVHDYGESQMDGEGRTAYLVMELVNGEPLNSVLKRTGRLSLRHALDMLEQTGRALQIAHAAGLVHRDVKPGNILITPTGQVKITDFGIAKAVDAAPVTQTGMVMGTAQYIAPEQALGHDATPSSDVYSLGVVGYEVVSGKRPFTGDGALTVAMKHIKEPPPPLPPELPPNVRELIEITLVKNPGMRYRSGGPFADAVAAVRAGRRPPRPSQSPPAGRAAPAAIPSGPQPGRHPSPVRVPLPPRRSRPATSSHRPPPARRTFSSGQRALLWAAGVLGALAIIIAVLIVINSRGDTQQQSPPPTVTDTGTPPASGPPPASKTPSGSGPSLRLDWTDRGTISNSGLHSRPPELSWANPLTPSLSPARRETAAMTTPQHLSDRYELGDILGFGGMSEVHLARDVRLHRDVAVKVLRADLARDPSFYLRFRREAQNAAALNHPAIVAVYDTGEAETPAGPLPYIVMEYVDGVTLRDIVHNDGPLPPRRAIEIIADACQALNFSHQNGIIHRDVKPANIMISTTNAVKVMDFGIARALADSGNSVTQTAAVIGTAQYLSPEQARGDSVDARSDVYSLGCVLYEMLTGEPPFTGDSPVSVAYQHVREDPVPPSKRYEGISAELDAVVLKALAKNPDNRYQTAAEMRADLVRVHNGEAPEAPKVFTDAERTSMMAATGPGHGSPRTDPLPRQRFNAADPDRMGGPVGRWVVAVAVLAVLTIVVVIGFNTFGGSTRDVQVPDMRGQVSADAVAALQNRGFKTRTLQKPDSSIPPDHVISTDPGANASVAAGDEITINVSTGPEQREVPDVSSLSYSDAVSKLKAAGFTKFKQANSPSTPELLGKVIGTNPPANQTSAITNVVTLIVGSGTRDQAGPRRRGPDGRRRTEEPHGLRLHQGHPGAGGQHPSRRRGDWHQSPQGPAGSGGLDHRAPGVQGQSIHDARPDRHVLDRRRTAVTRTGLDRGAGQGCRRRCRRLPVHIGWCTQNPPAGSGVNRDGLVTLKFGQ